MHTHTCIPEDYSSKAYEGIKAVVYTGVSSQGKPQAIGYKGRRKAPAFNRTFENNAELTEFVDGWISVHEVRKKAQDSYREERKAFAHTLEIGSILEASWGYEQTNVNFYEVTEVVSPKTVVVREIAVKTIPTINMGGTKTPLTGEFIGKPLTKRVALGNCIEIETCITASPWDGLPGEYSARR